MTKLPLADRLYRCTKCKRTARTNGEANDWYQRCVDAEGHDWREIQNER